MYNSVLATLVDSGNSMEFHYPYSAGNYLCFTGIYSPYTQSMVALNSECDDDYITNGFGIWIWNMEPFWTNQTYPLVI